MTCINLDGSHLRIKSFLIQTVIAMPAVLARSWTKVFFNAPEVQIRVHRHNMVIPCKTV